jgi:hypothetical protein
MYSKIPSLTIGFHGCDISIYNEVIKNNQICIRNINCIKGYFSPLETVNMLY